MSGDLWCGVRFPSPGHGKPNGSAGCRRHPLAGAHRLRCPRDPPGRGGKGRKVSALLYGDSSLSDLRPGDKLSCVAYCTPADASRGEDSLYYASQGIHLSAKAYGDITVTKAEGIPPRYALTILSGKIRQTIDCLYPEHEAGFLRAILTGDKSGLEQADKDNFNRVGLGHVVVISGLHVTFLMGVLTLFLDPRKKRSLLVLLPVLLAFCLMTGSGPGTVRASILCTLALLAPLLGREYNCFTGLSTALLLLLAWNPWAAANAGLQFSFLSTLGILLFGENWCKAWLKPFPRKAKRWLRPVFGILTVSLAAMVFTVPLSWYYFGRFSLIAPWRISARAERCPWPLWAGRCRCWWAQFVFPSGISWPGWRVCPFAIFSGLRGRPVRSAWRRWRWTGAIMRRGPCSSMGLCCCISWLRSKRNGLSCRPVPAW